MVETIFYVNQDVFIVRLGQTSNQPNTEINGTLKLVQNVLMDGKTEHSNPQLEEFLIWTPDNYFSSGSTSSSVIGGRGGRAGGGDGDVVIPENADKPPPSDHYQQQQHQQQPIRIPLDNIRAYRRRRMKVGHRYYCITFVVELPSVSSGSSPQHTQPPPFVFRQSPHFTNLELVLARFVRVTRDENDASLYYVTPQMPPQPLQQQQQSPPIREQPFSSSTKFHFKKSSTSSLASNSTSTTTPITTTAVGHSPHSFQGVRDNDDEVNAVGLTFDKLGLFDKSRQRQLEGFTTLKPVARRTAAGSGGMGTSRSAATNENGNAKLHHLTNTLMSNLAQIGRHLNQSGGGSGSGIANQEDAEMRKSVQSDLLRYQKSSSHTAGAASSSSSSHQSAQQHHHHQNGAGQSAANGGSASSSGGPPGSVMLTSCADEEDLGFEVVTQTRHVQLPDLPLVERETPLSEADWTNFVEPGSGRILCVSQLKLRIFRGGIQPALRPRVWRYLLGVDRWQLTNEENARRRAARHKRYLRIKAQWVLLDSEPQAINSQFRDRKNLIEKDVCRTDRHKSFFKSSAPHSNLCRLYDLLMTYAQFNADLGYVQGMNDLAALLLAVMSGANLDQCEVSQQAGASNQQPPPQHPQQQSQQPIEIESDTFWCFAALMRRLEPNFSSDQLGMRRQFRQLHTLLHCVDAAFAQYLDAQHSHELLFAFRWLLIQFKREFCYADTARLWEVIWTDYRCANFHLLVTSALLLQQRDVIMERQLGFNEILKHANELSNRIALEPLLMQAEQLLMQLHQVWTHVPDTVKDILELPPSSSGGDSAHTYAATQIGGEAGDSWTEQESETDTYRHSGGGGGGGSDLEFSGDRGRRHAELWQTLLRLELVVQPTTTAAEATANQRNECAVITQQPDHRDDGDGNKQ